MKLSAFTFVLLCLASWQCANTFEVIQKVQKEIITQLLADPLNPFIVPSNNSGPVVVKTNMYIRNIQAVDETKMQWKVQITYRQQWTDARLKFDDRRGTIRYINLPDSSKVWMPDTFFRNEIEAHYHDVIKRNELMRVYPNGDVLYSTRITLTLFCPMDLKVETHTCSILLASYAYTAPEISYAWKEKDPIQLDPILYVPRYTLETYKTGTCNAKTNTGEYSCLKADFIFHREANPYHPTTAASNATATGQV